VVLDARLIHHSASLQSHTCALPETTITLTTKHQTIANDHIWPQYYIGTDAAVLANLDAGILIDITSRTSGQTQLTMSTLPTTVVPSGSDSGTR
jgi:hypothetical protein